MQTVQPAAVDPPAPGSGSGLGLSSLSDELLARQAARGRARAFETIYQRYYQPLYQYCHSILRHEADAQDALQSTFAKALVALQKDQRKAPLRPWLYRIAHNEAISVIRSRRRDQPAEPSEIEVGTAMSAEDEVGAREQWTTLVSDLGELGENQRSALLLRELNGLSHEEIGVALETSTAGAKQFIFEARQALAEFAEGRAMACEDVRRRISDGDRRVLRGRKLRSHLRGCASCTAFAAAIPARQAELRAMAPVLAPVMAAELFSRVLSTAASHGAAGASAAASAAPSAIGAAGTVGKLAGGSALWKAVAGAVIVAGAAVGVAKLHHAHHHTPALPGTRLHRVVQPGRSSATGGSLNRRRTSTRHAAGHVKTRTARHRTLHRRAAATRARRSAGRGQHGRPLFAAGSLAPVIPPSAKAHHGGSQTSASQPPTSPGHSHAGGSGNSSNGQHRGSGGSRSSSPGHSHGSTSHGGGSGGQGNSGSHRGTSGGNSNSSSTSHGHGSGNSTSHGHGSGNSTSHGHGSGSSTSTTQTSVSRTATTTVSKTHHTSTHSRVTSTLTATSASTSTTTTTTKRNHGNSH